MFVLSFRAKRWKVATLCCVLIVAAVVGAIVFFNKDDGGTAILAQGSSEEMRVEYLKSMGWEVEEVSTVQDIIIPAEFDSVYEVYNSIQIQQGFDLSEYQGKTVKQYVYQITNYSDSDSMVATLLIYEGSIIGGDVSSTEKEGYMHRLQRSETQIESNEESVEAEQTDTDVQTEENIAEPEE